MKAFWRLPLAGVAAYLLILLITLPADRVARLLEQNITGLDLQSVSGTLFSGKADRVVIHGLGMGPVTWSLRPLSLLLARLEYRLDLKDPFGDLLDPVGDSKTVHRGQGKGLGSPSG